MTDEITNLRTLLEKSSDADLLREMRAVGRPQRWSTGGIPFQNCAPSFRLRRSTRAWPEPMPAEIEHSFRERP
jgi:hypothetical protein